MEALNTGFTIWLRAKILVLKREENRMLQYVICWKYTEF